MLPQDDALQIHASVHDLRVFSFCCWAQRAELANEQYLALTLVLEGVVILKPNPEWKADGDKVVSPSKKKTELEIQGDDDLKKMALKMANVRPDQRMYGK